MALTILDGTATVSRSIIANNSSPDPATPNCASDPDGQPRPARSGSAGGNVESGTDCGFTAGGDRQSTDPQLGGLADNGGPTDTHALSLHEPRPRHRRHRLPRPTSAAPRRPQGAACDSGAFEFSVFPGRHHRRSDGDRDRRGHGQRRGSPEGQPTAFRFQFGRTAAYGSEVPAAPVPPAAARALLATLTGLESDTTYHYRLTAASPAGSAVGADRTFTTLKTIADLPPPIIGKTTNVEPVSGIVLVALPAKPARRPARRRCPEGPPVRPPAAGASDPGRLVPRHQAGPGDGSRRARTRTRRGQAPVGTVLQRPVPGAAVARRGAKGLTELRLKGSSFRPCRRRGRRAGASAHSSASRRIRRLGANARGRFPHPRSPLGCHGPGDQVDRDRPLRRHAHHRSPAARSPYATSAGEDHRADPWQELSRPGPRALGKVAIARRRWFRLARPMWPVRVTRASRAGRMLLAFAAVAVVAFVRSGPAFGLAAAADQSPTPTTAARARCATRSTPRAAAM